LADDVPWYKGARIQHQDRFGVVYRMTAQLSGTATDVAKASKADVLELNRHDSVRRDNV
jgi:hypothetical protein